MNGAVSGRIRHLRRRLVEARRSQRHEMIDEIVAGIRELSGRGYRCCLIDYERLRPACYVRVLGFEKGRIKAQVEFPIRPGLRREQWLPLSHLADYEETEPESLRGVYDEVREFLKHREATLDRQRPRPCGGPALSRPRRSRSRRPMKGPPPTVWWGVAGALFTCSLVLFIVTI